MDFNCFSRIPGKETREPQSGSHVSRETSPHPPNGKRSSFYVYLAVLFGAAFLMLLLAYFVQRRNNETAISALRSTMDLSREKRRRSRPRWTS